MALQFLGLSLGQKAPVHAGGPSSAVARQ